MGYKPILTLSLLNVVVATLQQNFFTPVITLVTNVSLQSFAVMTYLSGDNLYLSPYRALPPIQLTGDL